MNLHKEGALKLTLDGENLQNFIKDDAMQQIHGKNHKIKVLETDLLLLKKASLISKNFTLIFED